MTTKLEQQIDKALAVLAAQTKPVRYIVRKPRKGGKRRHPGLGVKVAAHKRHWPDVLSDKPRKGSKAHKRRAH